MSVLTADELRRIVSYDPETGDFTWLVKRGTARPGDRAGTMSRGYVRITINRQGHHAHRLAWFIAYGEWPKSDIDHINGDKSDNRLSNLREASASENGCNRGLPSNNSSGLKGIYTVTDGRTWYSKIQANGRPKYLGTFPTAEEAHAAYCAAAAVLHGEFARTA